MASDDDRTWLGRPSRAAHAGFTPTCLASSSAAFKSLSRRRGLIPSSPATFPCTSMIRRALSSSFSRRVFSRSSLRTFPSSGFRSLGFRPRLFDSALSHPLRTALRHVVRCDEYKPSRRRSRPTSPGSVHRSASSTTRSLYDGLNRRRVGLSTTSASGAAAALRLSSQVSGAIPFSSILSRCLSILGFSAFALL